MEDLDGRVAVVTGAASGRPKRSTNAISATSGRRSLVGKGFSGYPAAMWHAVENCSGIPSSSLTAGSLATSNVVNDVATPARRRARQRFWAIG